MNSYYLNNSNYTFNMNGNKDNASDIIRKMNYDYITIHAVGHRMNTYLSISIVCSFSQIHF